MAGRPKLPENEAKQVFTLRISRDEILAIEAAAQKAGKKPREWARETLLAKAGGKG